MTMSKLRTSREKRAGQVLVNRMGCDERQAGEGGAKKSEARRWDLKMNGPEVRESCERSSEAKL